MSFQFLRESIVCRGQGSAELWSTIVKKAPNGTGETVELAAIGLDTAQRMRLSRLLAGDMFVNPYQAGYQVVAKPVLWSVPTKPPRRAGQRFQHPHKPLAKLSVQQSAGLVEERTGPQ